MDQHRIVSPGDWLAARKALLVQEKKFTRDRDALSQARRNLPWVKIDKTYMFDTVDAKQSLSDLFAGQQQLIVYHFMFHPDWNAGCKSCSFWADNFAAIGPHLAARDTSLVLVSRAPLAKIDEFKRRMDWTLPWVSSAGSDFNRDLGVQFTPEELAGGAVNYNFGPNRFPVEDAPGISVFTQDDTGAIFRTYSCYSRGLDMMNAAYHLLDLTPKGRDEAGLPHSMAWLRLHDDYGR